MGHGLGCFFEISVGESDGLSVAVCLDKGYVILPLIERRMQSFAE
jgi:hypothetical protein